jgi:hypothetical protein
MCNVHFAGLGRWLEHKALATCGTCASHGHEAVHTCQAVQLQLPAHMVEQVVKNLTVMATCVLKYFSKHVAANGKGRLNAWLSQKSHEDARECAGVHVNVYLMLCFVNTVIHIIGTVFHIIALTEVP